MTVSARLRSAPEVPGWLYKTHSIGLHCRATWSGGLRGAWGYTAPAWRPHSEIYLVWGSQALELAIVAAHYLLCLTLWFYGLQHACLPILHYLPEFAQPHVHWGGDAIQLSFIRIIHLSNHYSLELDLGPNLDFSPHFGYNLRHITEVKYLISKGEDHCWVRSSWGLH